MERMGISEHSAPLLSLVPIPIYHVHSCIVVSPKLGVLIATPNVLINSRLLFKEDPAFPTSLDSSAENVNPLCAARTKELRQLT